MVIYHSGGPPNPDPCIHQSTRKRLNHASHCPNLPYPHMVPGEEVKDLLLAAGDSSKSFHNGTCCLPCCLCRWGKEYLPDMGEKIGPAQRPPCFSRPRILADFQTPRIVTVSLGTVKGPYHQLTQYPVVADLRKAARELLASQKILQTTWRTHCP